MTPTANSQKRRLSLSTSGPSRSILAGKPPREAKTDFDSRELFGGTRQIHIHHNDETYRLSITKQGKLILTK
ncbi:hemin uptake protein HemP [Roseibium marinum]|uniref:Hemin uptake protein HemP n=1 Tax=Roseibium marinum TaxID=281252 RepID=A0A2S3V3P4_9HYPH|nr:hemin uptake protein HemP [Roseibium marinum]POF34556.1 hemin uptake protein HemP [Roseibium marinum]